MPGARKKRKVLPKSPSKNDSLADVYFTDELAQAERVSFVSSKLKDFKRFVALP